MTAPCWLRARGDRGAVVSGASRLLELAQALGRPLDLAPDAASRLVAQLPARERRLVEDGTIELVVPIPPAPGAGRRAALPPARREAIGRAVHRGRREFLAAIADSLGRHAAGPHGSPGAGRRATDAVTRAARPHDAR